jgi:hypothetical protein
MGEAVSEPPPYDHDAHVEVTMTDCTVTCTCGWSFKAVRRRDAMSRWYGPLRL